MKINRNIFWTEIFFNELIKLGIKDVCIAPGSRSTPLVFAVANNPKLHPYVFIDERSCSFFALGLAKKSKFPVVLVCTSGTAVAEFYPAIIEAYQQKVPLIVCTADRPPELIDNKANQTINQKDIYENHINWSCNAGLPEILPERLKNIRIIGKRAFFESFIFNKGPVHINFPFRKPFEPETYTDEMDSKSKTLFLEDSAVNNNLLLISSEMHNVNLHDIATYIKSCRKGIIVAGPDNYFQEYSHECIELAQKLNFPIFADGASNFRYRETISQNIFVNYDSFLRSKNFVNCNQPDIILQFGQSVTSKGLENYLENTRAKRFVINETGDWYDPYNNAEAVIKINPGYFCNEINRLLGINLNQDNEWLNSFLKAEKIAENLKREIIYDAEFPFESRIINEVMLEIPEGSSIMISNSMPIRDLDFFAPLVNKNIYVYSNRGASGIDGIISTALGITAASNKPVFLITGDLAFYHDLNGLLAAKKYSLPIIIILINNNGGGIFQMLPVSKHEETLNTFFTTPHNLDFAYFVKGYNGNYRIIENWNNFHIEIQNALKANTFSVLQINTNAKESVNLRRHFWDELEKRMQ